MKCESPCKRDLKPSSATKLIPQFEYAIYLDLVIDIYRCKNYHSNVVCKICGERIKFLSSFFNTFADHLYISHTKCNSVRNIGEYGILVERLGIMIRFPHMDSYKLFLTGNFKPLVDFMTEAMKYEDTSALESSYTINRLPHLEHKFNEIYAACLTTCIVCGLNYESPPTKEVVYAHLRFAHRCDARC